MNSLYTKLEIVELEFDLAQILILITKEYDLNTSKKIGIYLQSIFKMSFIVLHEISHLFSKYLLILNNEGYRFLIVFAATLIPYHN